MKKSPEILECTLRDGSYTIDFMFSSKDTFNIAKRLDELDFPFIEVGHGIGLGASKKGFGIAAASDEEYMESAFNAVKKNKWGMFCIPGIAELEDVHKCNSFKMDFIRIGFEIGDVDKAIPFIKLARKLGIYVFCNIMKSYASTINDFFEESEKCISNGAQCIYIVDSAGGMLPNQIKDYSLKIKEFFPDIKIGFHGHHNIGMAVANSLYCSNHGFDIIDTSLQGIGRSAGNTPTEQFIAALIQDGFEVKYDIVEVSSAGETLINPLLNSKGINSLDLVSGLALFHSSYMKRVIGISREYNVDPRYLILEITKHDKLNAPIELINKCALKLQKDKKIKDTILMKPYFGEEQK